jgi:hypothetical protein
MKGSTIRASISTPGRTDDCRSSISDENDPRLRSAIGGSPPVYPGGDEDKEVEESCKMSGMDSISLVGSSLS